MANNRMWLGCRVCQECIAFTKFFPSRGWATVPEADRKIDLFFERHEELHGLADAEDMYEFFLESARPLEEADNRWYFPNQEGE